MEHYCHWRQCIRCTRSCTTALQLLSEIKFSKFDIYPLVSLKGKKDVAYFRAMKVVSDPAEAISTVLLFSLPQASLLSQKASFAAVTEASADHRCVRYDMRTQNLPVCH